MNKDRRKAIDAILKALNDMGEKIDGLSAEVQEIADEEQDYYDNMADNFRDGEKGTTASEAIDNLNSAVEQIDAMRTSLEEAVYSLEAAKG